jgi:hypothetical protein
MQNAGIIVLRETYDKQTISLSPAILRWVATPDPGEAPPLAGFNMNILGCIICQPAIITLSIEK